jgi:dTDP-4-dehydrorhamnose 3,5-epimerase
VELRSTRLNGPLLIALNAFGDDRGFFVETFRQDRYAEFGITEQMVQDNHSRSARGIVRGMHFQIGKGTSKLVRCARGAIWDVVVDVRQGSPTYGEWEGFDLSEANMHVLYCPVGFAHGFCVTCETADVVYKQSNYYSAEVERGFAYDDPDVGIAWPLSADAITVSERDDRAPLLREIASQIPFRALQDRT